MVGSSRHHNGRSIEACAAMVVFRRLIGIVAAMLAAGCASTQLNYNAADLATSLNSLTKKQIFFNLAQAINDPEFVPSQATISIGTAQTINAISPSLSLPLGPPIATTSRFYGGGQSQCPILDPADDRLACPGTAGYRRLEPELDNGSRQFCKPAQAAAIPLSVRHGNAAPRRHDQRSE
jgi:hypothetical protein